MTEEQAKQIIKLLKEINGNLEDISSNAAAMQDYLYNLQKAVREK